MTQEGNNVADITSLYSAIVVTDERLTASRKYNRKKESVLILMPF